jgi:hypothetical protein
VIAKSLQNEVFRKNNAHRIRVVGKENEELVTYFPELKTVLKRV